MTISKNRGPKNRGPKNRDPTDRDEVSRSLAELKQFEAAPAESGDAPRIVGDAAVVLDRCIARPQAQLSDELRALAGLIRRMRSDIVADHGDEIRGEHLRAAGDELDAVVAATEEATGAVLESAEEIEGIASGLDGAKKERIVSAVGRIYEACGFQDITGQRIGNVIDALKQVEERVATLVEMFAEDAPGKRKRSRGMNAKTKRNEGQSEAGLLNGPQMPADAVKQDDIDALFDKLD